MTKVILSWGNKKLDIVCHSDKPVKDFMLEIQKLTGVPIERQKLSIRRKQLKIDDKFDTEIIEGTRFMLIGTAEKPPEPVEVPDSDSEPVEDENVDEDGFSSAEKKKILQGLPNFANNCYLNASLQSLRALPEAESIIEASVVPKGTNEANVEQAISNLFKNFPNEFNQAFAELRKANPNLFAAVDDKGLPMQQDASESFFYIINTIGKVLGDPFKRLFNIGIHNESKCIETGKVEENDESTNNIPVYITQDTRQIEQGINFDQDDVRKDDALNQEVHFHSHRTITSLPQYLIFHIQRFEFKKDENITVKILRKIIHPFRIDMLQWLHPDLRKQIANDRESGKSNSGFYSLKVVLTHQGRSASGGHYITHCRYGTQWFRFDDNKEVKDIGEDDISALTGSGDWHSSLILIYEKMSSE